MCPIDTFIQGDVGPQGMQGEDGIPGLSGVPGLRVMLLQYNPNLDVPILTSIYRVPLEMLDYQVSMGQLE